MIKDPYRMTILCPLFIFFCLSWCVWLCSNFFLQPLLSTAPVVAARVDKNFLRFIGFSPYSISASYFKPPTLSYPPKRVSPMLINPDFWGDSPHKAGVVNRHFGRNDNGHLPLMSGLSIQNSIIQYPESCIMSMMHSDFWIPWHYLFCTNNSSHRFLNCSRMDV